MNQQEGFIDRIVSVGNFLIGIFNPFSINQCYRLCIAMLFDEGITEFIDLDKTAFVKYPNLNPEIANNRFLECEIIPAQNELTSLLEGNFICASCQVKIKEGDRGVIVNDKRYCCNVCSVMQLGKLKIKGKK